MGRKKNQDLITKPRSDSIHSLREEFLLEQQQPIPTKKPRKSKKMNDKELLHELFSDNLCLTESFSGEPAPLVSVQSMPTVLSDLDSEREKSPKKQRPPAKKKEEDRTKYTTENYNNFMYLSNKEKAAFEKKFTVPRTATQHKYVDLLRDRAKKIVIANGPAGTGKTLFATEYAVRFFLTNTYEKIIITRPSVSVDEELGFLPGTLEEKMAPWVRPIYDILYQFFSPKEVQELIDEKTIEIAPLGFMRGRTFKNAWIVADEMQNSTVSQMKMLLTRLGENSRLIVTGDLEQFDRTFEYNGLQDFLRKFKERGETQKSSIVTFEFDKTDIQREEVVKEVLDIYG
jgi:phosphate starvation-inducible PhoH-like protein